VLVRSLLCTFYGKDELLTKNFSDLDKEITEACVGKYIQNPSETLLKRHDIGEETGLCICSAIKWYF